MSIETVEGQLLEIVSRVTKIPKEKLSPTDDLIEKHGVDSMQRIEVLIEVEKAFGITTPDEEAQRLRHVTDFLKLIDKYKVTKK